MPFPFKALPYGVMQRFHVLATPVEVYRLQVAAGADIRNLCPIIKVTTPSDSLELSIEDTNKTSLVDLSTKTELADFDGVIVVLNNLYLWKIDVTHVDNPIFDRMYLDVDQIEFTMCAVNYALLKKISSNLYSSKGYSLFFDRSTFNEHVSLYSLLTLFPECRDLFFGDEYIYNGWVDDLSKLGSTKLGSLFFATHCVDFFTLNPDKLATFIYSQERNFCLEVNFLDINTYPMSFERLEQFLGKPFTDLIKVTHEDVVTVTFCRNNA